MLEKYKRKKNAKLNTNSAYNGAFLLNCAFLIIHIAFFALFLMLGYKYLYILNLISCLIYIWNYVLLKRKLLYRFTWITYTEINIYVTISIHLLGWKLGFQLCYLALVFLMFYADYFSLKVGTRRIKGIYACLIEMLLYLFMYIHAQFCQPIYNMSIHYTRNIYQILTSFVFITMGYFMMSLLGYIRELERMIKLQSRRDGLTSTYNRIGLQEFVDSINPKDLSNYCAAIFDIDDFKLFNDQYGHNCGDFVLKSIAEIATEMIEDGIVCRWGGEEFVIISKINKDIEDSYKAINRIRQRIADTHFEYNGQGIRRVTITAGLAAYEKDMNLKSWVAKADEKLYRGKESGKNVVVL